jgi:hypothetical protein
MAERSEGTEVSSPSMITTNAKIAVSSAGVVMQIAFLEHGVHCIAYLLTSRVHHQHSNTEQNQPLSISSF